MPKQPKKQRIGQWCCTKSAPRLRRALLFSFAFLSRYRALRAARCANHLWDSESFESTIVRLHAAASARCVPGAKMEHFFEPPQRIRQFQRRAPSVSSASPTSPECRACGPSEAFWWVWTPSRADAPLALQTVGRRTPCTTFSPSNELSSTPRGSRREGPMEPPWARRAHGPPKTKLVNCAWCN